MKKLFLHLSLLLPISTIQAINDVKSSIGYSKFQTGERGIAFSQQYVISRNNFFRFGCSLTHSQGVKKIPNALFFNQLTRTQLTTDFGISPIFFRRHEIGLEGNFGVCYLTLSEAFRKIMTEVHTDHTIPSTRDIYDVSTTIYIKPAWGFSAFYNYHVNEKWLLGLRYSQQFSIVQNYALAICLGLRIGHSHED